MNDFRSFLRQAPLLTQLFVLLALALLGAGLMGAMGVLASQTFFGADLASIEQFIENPATPHAVLVLKVLQIFTTMGMFLLPAMVFSQLVSPQPTWFLRVHEAPKLPLLVAVTALFLVFIPVTDGLTWLNQNLHLPGFLAAFEAEARAASERTQTLIGSFLVMHSLGDFLLNLFLLAVLPALAEEFFFRGILQELIFRKTHKTHVAVWSAALAFGLMHSQFFSLLPLVVLGALLGYLRAWSGSLWPSIVAHFVNNGAIVVVMYFGHLNMADLETLSTPKPTWLLLAVAISAVLIFLLYKTRAVPFADNEDLLPEPPEDYSGM